MNLCTIRWLYPLWYVSKNIKKKCCIKPGLDATFFNFTLDLTRKRASEHETGAYVAHFVVLYACQKQKHPGSLEWLTICLGASRLDHKVLRV